MQHEATLDPLQSGCEESKVVCLLETLLGGVEKSLSVSPGRLHRTPGFRVMRENLSLNKIALWDSGGGN